MEDDSPIIDSSNIEKRFDRINIWKRKGTRAVHKPLIILFALARLQRKEDRLVSFKEAEPELKQLLRTYGPRTETGLSRIRPQYPFWRLQKDGEIWEIPENSQIAKNPNGDVSVVELREIGHGGFTIEVERYLRQHPEVVNRIAGRILAEFFPRIAHDKILDDVGMPYVVETVVEKRDPGFRRLILRIYEHRCALCGYDGRLGDSDLGLEAAHYKWLSEGGPNTKKDGVALCTYHHATLDLGAWGLDANRRVIVSQDVHGRSEVDNYLLRFHGKSLKEPQSGEPVIGKEFIDWHRKVIFRHPSRRMK